MEHSSKFCLTNSGVHDSHAGVLCFEFSWSVDHLISGFDSALSVAFMYSSIGFNNIKLVQD